MSDWRTERSAIRAAIAVVLVTAFSAFPVAAEPSNRAAAESLFEAGRRAMERKDYAEACSKFEASNQLDPAVGTLFNLANCNELRGRLASAWQLFREVNDKLAPGDERDPLAQKRAEDLEPRLPRLTVKLEEGSPAGTRIVLDGTALPEAMLGVSVPVDPGAHTAIVRAPGRADRKFDVNLVESQSTTLMVGPGPATPEAGPAPARPVETPRTRPPTEAPGSPTLGYVIGGVGVASLGASLVTGLLALSKHGVVEDHCSPKPGGNGQFCDTEGLAAGDSGKSLALISDVTLAAGVVGVGVGAFLVLRAHPSERTEVSVAPLPGGGTLDVRGRF